MNVYKKKMDKLTHTFKRTRTYTKYYQDRKLVQQVLQFFRENPGRNYSLREVANKVGMDENVLCKWRLAFEKDDTVNTEGDSHANKSAL